MAWHEPSAARAIWTGFGAVPVPPTEGGSSAANSKLPVLRSTRVPAPIVPSVRRWTTARAGSAATRRRTASTASRIGGGDGAVVMGCMLGRPGGTGGPPPEAGPAAHRLGDRRRVDGGAPHPGGAGAGAGRGLLAQRPGGGRPRPPVGRAAPGRDRRPRRPARGRPGRRAGRTAAVGPLRHLGPEPVLHHRRLVGGAGGHPAGVGGAPGPGPGPDRAGPGLAGDRRDRRRRRPPHRRRRVAVGPGAGRRPPGPG